jgi:AraC family transcriptional regulator, exoenzyme S synthesis regulatory protein ExsA
MIRFPQILLKHKDKYFLSIGSRPYARYHTLHNPDDTKKVGFLTENTFFFVSKGTKIFYFEDHHIKIDKDHPALLKKGIYTMSEYITEEEGFEALVIFIPDQFMKQFRFNESSIESLHETDRPYAMIQPDELLTSFMTQYMSFFGKSIDHLETILQLKLQELFYLLCSKINKDKLMGFIYSVVSDKPVDLEFLIQNHLLQPLTITELAVLSGRSLSAFKRDFQERYRCAPKQWINQKRLAYAQRSLLRTDKNVSEIAYECGFENASHFIKIYKRHYGSTPNSVRAEKTTI